MQNNDDKINIFWSSRLLSYDNDQLKHHSQILIYFCFLPDSLSLTWEKENTEQSNSIHIILIYIKMNDNHHS